MFEKGLFIRYPLSSGNCFYISNFTNMVIHGKDSTLQLLFFCLVNLCL